jgi:hypothetical protein
MTVSSWILLTMRNVSHKSCRENQTTQFMTNNFVSENRAIYEIKWENTVKPDRPQMTIWCIRSACWITKATNRHSECIVVFAYPPQQWLHEQASMLHYTYIVCLVCTPLRWLVFCTVLWTVIKGGVEHTFSLSCKHRHFRLSYRRGQTGQKTVWQFF